LGEPDYYPSGHTDGTVMDVSGGGTGHIHDGERAAELLRDRIKGDGTAAGRVDCCSSTAAAAAGAEIEHGREQHTDYRYLIQYSHDRISCYLALIRSLYDHYITYFYGYSNKSPRRAGTISGHHQADIILLSRQLACARCCATVI